MSPTKTIVDVVLGQNSKRIKCSSGENGETKEIIFHSWQSFYAFINAILQARVEKLKELLPGKRDESTNQPLQELRRQQEEFSGLKIVRDYKVDLSQYYGSCLRFGLQPKLLYKKPNLQLIWNLSCDLPPELSSDNLERFLLLWASVVARKPGGGRIEIQIYNFGEKNLKLTVPFFPSQISDVAALSFTCRKIHGVQAFLNHVNWGFSDVEFPKIQRQEQMYLLEFDSLARMFQNEDPELAVSSVYNTITLGS